MEVAFCLGNCQSLNSLLPPTLLLWKKSNAMEVENWFKSLNFVALK